VRNFILEYSRTTQQSRIVIQLLFALLVIAVSIVFFALSLGKPYMGVVLSKNQQGWVIESVDSNGIAKNARISNGDKPIMINGLNANEFLARYKDNPTVFGTEFRELSVIDKDGMLKSAILYQSSLSWQALTEQISWFIISLVFWIIGVYALVRRPKVVAANLLFLSALALGLVLSANLATAINVSTALQFHVIALIISPWILFHFFLTLPEERSHLNHNPFICFIYLLPIITIILFPLIGYSDGQPVEWFRVSRLIEVGFGILASAVVIVFNFIRAVSIHTRQQMKIILFSCLIALVPLIALNILPAAIIAKQTTGVSLLCLIFIPLGLGYAVVKRRLMDIDIIIRRGIIYTLVTLIMAAILSVVIFFVLEFQGTLGIPEDIILAIILGGAATVLFGPIKKGIEILIDKFLYKDRYDYRKTIEILSNSLKSINNFTDVSRVIVGTLTHTLNLASTCLLMKTEDTLEVSAAQGIFTDKNYQYQLKRIISQNGQKLHFPNVASSLDPNLYFLVPLIFEEKEIGILCLSNKASMQRFSSDDIFLIQGIASIAAIALHSAILVRDVNMKNTFVSVASHELRTPLTAIMGYAELMMRHEQSDTNKKRLQNILDNGQKISNMAVELLNVSRIQSDKIVLKLEHLRLSDILSEQIEMTKELTDKHEIVTDIDAGLPDVTADHDKLSQVIANLLGNAVKYSPKGGRIIISAHPDPSQNFITISIKDEGIGISHEDKNLLFTTFHRIQRPETQGIRGSGLGLFIAKEWTEAMGGKIWVESELNRGSTFFITIPE
jgi:signal transduction histidine kinase